MKMEELLAFGIPLHILVCELFLFLTYHFWNIFITCIGTTVLRICLRGVNSVVKD